jgi:hypothetical protein
MTPETIAENAIGLFLEYRDKHERSEEVAKACAINEVTEGTEDFVVLDKQLYDDLVAALKALMPEGWDDGTMNHMPGVKQACTVLAKLPKDEK